MNISKLSELMNFGMGRIQPGESGKISQSINTKDGFTSTSPESASFSKPVIAKSAPADQEVQPGDTRAKGAALTGFYSATASFGAISGTTGAALTAANTSALEKRLQSLADKKIEFFQDRGWKAPLFLGNPKKLTPKDAAGILTSGQQKLKDKLQVKVPDAEFAPVDNPADVDKLEVFYGNSASGKIKNPMLAEFLKDAKLEKITFTTEDKTQISIYEAYNLLSGDRKEAGKKPVRVYAGLGEYPLMELSEEKMKDMKAFGEELKEFHKEFARFVDWSWVKRESFMEILSKPDNGMPLKEKFEILKMLKGNRQSIEGLEAYYSVSKAFEPGADLKQLGDHYLEIKKTVTYNDNDDPLKYKLAEESLLYAEKNLKGKGEEEAVFLNMVRRSRNVKFSAEAMKTVEKPVGKESYKERLVAIRDLVEAYGEEGISKYSYIRKNLLPGQAFLEGVNEFVKAKNENWQKEQERDFLRNRKKISSNPLESKVYIDMVNLTGSPRKTWQMMEEAKKPIDGTTYEEQLKVMNELAGSIPDWKSDRTEDIVGCYQYLAKNRKPSEKLIDICNKFSPIMKSIANGFKTANHSKLCLEFIRKDLGEDPQKEADFMKILGAVGDGYVAINAYKYIQKPLKDEDYSTRLNVFLKILPNHLDSIEQDVPSWKTVMEKIVEHICPGENLETVADQYVAINKAKGSPNYAQGPYKFFDEFKKKYGGDMSRFDKLLEMVRYTFSFEKTEAGVDLLEKPVRNELYKDRMAVLNKIDDTIKSGMEREGKVESGPFAVNLYEFISSNSSQNETMPQIIDQYVDFCKALKISSGNQGFSKFDVEFFREAKAKFIGRPQEMEKFTRIMEKFAYGKAFEAKDVLDKQLKDESFEDREKILMEMLNFHDKDKYPRAEAVETYKPVAEGILGNESLRDAWNRFKKLHELMQTDKEIRGEKFNLNMVRDIFRQITDEVNKGTINSSALDSVMSKLLSGVILGEGVQDIMNSIKASVKTENRIVDQKESVVIGGVKLKKRGSFADILRSIKTDLGV